MSFFTKFNIFKRSNKDQPSSKLWRYTKTALSWLVAIVIALALQRYAFQTYQVYGQSMQPTLSEGDYLIISKLPISWSEFKNRDYQPRRGDIVVLNSPIDGSRLIKRVIGLPDERVVVSNGSVKIYNSEFPQSFEPYSQLGLPAAHVSGQVNVIVPEDHVFVVGDNREAGGSLDSRNELGPVPIDNIVGELVLRLWPFGEFQTF